jgi:hypothetical protein
LLCELSVLSLSEVDAEYKTKNMHQKTNTQKLLSLMTNNWRIFEYFAIKMFVFNYIDLFVES